MLRHVRSIAHLIVYRGGTLHTHHLQREPDHTCSHTTATACDDASAALQHLRESLPPERLLEHVEQLCARLERRVLLWQWPGERARRRLELKLPPVFAELWRVRAEGGRCFGGRHRQRGCERRVEVYGVEEGSEGERVRVWDVPAREAGARFGCGAKVPNGEVD